MTTPHTPPTVTAFAGDLRLATGALAEVALSVKAALAHDAAAPVLVFDDTSGRVIDLDLSGDVTAVAARYAPPAQAQEEPRGKGRPKLGVTAREVTLLPRHWDWLAAQPGGASAALRRLVEAARRADGDATDRRAAQEKAYRVMTALAGDRPGYEEATRALFAGDAIQLAAQLSQWPTDIRVYVTALVNQDD